MDGYLDLSEVKTVRVLPGEIERFRLYPGDVLLTEGGDFDKVGRGTVLNGEIDPCLHQNHVFRVRVNRDFLTLEFFSLVTGSFYGKRYFLYCSKQTTNLASINSSQVKVFPVPVPTLPEQNRIISVIHQHDLDVHLLVDELQKLNYLKHGLMQDLLTGQVRVNKVVKGHKYVSKQ